ncbi:MAG: hypothetical protein NVS3B16_16790 [Vulcanimicrobiaceae bacterium]
MEISERLADSQLLALLAADRILTVQKSGAPVPDTEHFVGVHELANFLILNRLLALRSAGRIAMEVQEKKILFVKSHHVEVTATGVPSDSPDEALLGTMPVGTAHSVHDLIYRWFEMDVSSPDAYVVSAAYAVGARSGVLVPVEEHRTGLGKIFHSSWTRYTIEPTCAARLGPVLDPVVERWQAFTRDEAALYKQLTADISSGLSSRTEADTSSD